VEAFLRQKQGMIKKEKLLKYLRACAVCHNYFPPCDWLCSFCWKCLEREYLYSEDTYRAEKTLPHLRLLDWHEDNSVLIQSFIQSLKQASVEFIFKRLALEMFSRFITIPLWDKNQVPLFIPVPPRQKNTKDHAYFLAKALNFYFMGEMIPMLEREKDWQSQKRKNKRERAKISILKTKKMDLSKHPIILVDDVVTTGSTARACWQALEQPENFFIFSLAWRRPLKDHFKMDNKLNF